jgi:hypothetical protein
MPHKDPLQRAKYLEDRRKHWKESGCCDLCGKDLSVEDHKYTSCNLCRDRRSLYWKKRRETKDINYVIERKQKRSAYARNRELAIQYYGGKCACCGEIELTFLDLDHINNDGAYHRRTDSTARNSATWAKKHGYPPIFQVLCSNCNQGKQRNGGVCPHQIK